MILHKWQIMLVIRTENIWQRWKTSFSVHPSRIAAVQPLLCGTHLLFAASLTHSQFYSAIANKFVGFIHFLALLSIAVRIHYGRSCSIITLLSHCNEIHEYSSIWLCVFTPIFKTSCFTHSRSYSLQQSSFALVELIQDYVFLIPPSPHALKDWL